VRQCRAGSRGLLAPRCSGQRVDRIGEGIKECVSLGVDLDAAAGRERFAQETSVLRERVHVAGLAKLLDQPRRALDVREEKCDDAGRKIHTHRSRSSAANDGPSSRRHVRCLSHRGRMF
jgi:hypothetical protein